MNKSFSESPNTGTDFSGVVEQSCIVNQSSSTGTLCDITNHKAESALKFLGTVPTVTDNPENMAIQPPQNSKKIRKNTDALLRPKQLEHSWQLLHGFWTHHKHVLCVKDSCENMNICINLIKLKTHSTLRLFS